MATNAFTPRLKTKSAMRHVRRLGIHVALQAGETSLAPDQQHARHAAVWNVAGGATFHFHDRVLEKEWAALLDMTACTPFPIGLAQHRLVASAMRAVAVRTFHQAFGNAMMAWQRKLSGDDAVTGKTKFRL